MINSNTFENKAVFNKNAPGLTDYSIHFAKLHSKSISRSIQWFIKRAVIDILGTLIGVILILPIILIVAFLIKLDSKGPVLFKQKRIGRFGKEFYMYKFRSMHVDAESKLGELLKYNQTNECMFKLSNDPRVTRVGKFLRKYSLDELPQLINVLKGEMSLIGFRPPIPIELEKYNSWHYLRFSSMPGLTGPWQVGGRSNITNFNKVVKLEVEYFQNWSLLKDIIILFKTVYVVISAEGAA